MKGSGQKTRKKKTPEIATVRVQEASPKVDTGNNTLDSLFNEELAKSEKYDQEVVSIVKRHLAKKELSSKAGAKLAEDLINFARLSLSESRK